MPIRYARGDKSVAMCPMCGLVVDYLDVIKDHRGKWVCSSCLDVAPPPAPKTPFVDAQALRHPQPFRHALPTVSVDEPERPSMSKRPFSSD